MADLTLTNVENHADPATPFSLMWAIEQLGEEGGKIEAGRGAMHADGDLIIPSNIEFSGSGVSTVIKQHSKTSHGILMKGESNGLRDVHVEMPVDSVGGFAAVAFGVGSGLKWAQAHNLTVTGGNPDTWSFIVDQHYNCQFSKFLFESKRAHLPAMNGMKIGNKSTTWNTGDSTYRDITLRIKGNTIGLLIDTNAESSINNILFANFQVLGDNKGEGTAAIIKNRVKRCTFINADMEGCKESWIIDGAQSTDNDFIGCTSFGAANTLSTRLSIGSNRFTGGNILNNVRLIDE